MPAEGIKAPDFLWLSGGEDQLRPVLIDVGATNEMWLADVRRWRDWFSRLENRISFCADFGVAHAYKNVVPEFLLIGGTDGRMRPDGVTAVTLDHMKPDRDAAPYICATKNGARFNALSVSPMLMLGPASAVELCRISRLDDAVENNEYLSSERRQFLIERLPFWTRWVSAQKRLPALVRWDDWE